MVKLRTTLRRVYILLLLLLGKPGNGYMLISGIILLFISSLFHLYSSGFLRKERELITAGPYSFVRNPFYVANFFGDLAIYLISPNNYVAVVYFAIFYLWVIPRRVKQEEKSLASIFGEKYKEYTREVFRFLPLKRVPERFRNGSFSIQTLIDNQEMPRFINSINLIPMLLGAGEIKKNGFSRNAYLFVLCVVIIYTCAAVLRRYLKRFRRTE